MNNSRSCEIAGHRGKDYKSEIAVPQAKARLAGTDLGQDCISSLP